MMKLGISGITGKMGRSILELIDKSDKFELTSGLSSKSSIDDIKNCISRSDVLLDFSSSDSIENIVKIASQFQTSLLIGTTGLSEKKFDLLKKISLKLPILYAPNTSIGANLVAMLSSKAVNILTNYDVEIIEAHHRHKKDAPSGTALMIGKKIADSSGVNLNDVAVFDRSKNGKRKDGEIGFSSIRGGGIFGENEVVFAGDNEIFTIGARALSRNVFAEGALSAASWLYKQKPGFYEMSDYLKDILH